MRAASGGLVTLINGQRQFLVANLVTIVPVGAPIVRLTDADQNLTLTSQYDGAAHTFLSTVPAANAVPAMKCGATKLTVGLSTDKKTLTLLCGQPGVTNAPLFTGIPWPAAAQQGAFDDATVLVEKLLTNSWAALSAGTLIDFWGKVSQVKPSRFQVVLELASWVEVILAQQLPRNAYQLQCHHTLFDAGCTLVRSTFKVSGTAHAGSTATSIATGLGNPDGYFALGTITFTSGILNGVTRSIASFLSGAAVVIGPFPAAPTIGDTFDAYPGCDKLQATCTAKFSNLAHFAGMPFIPAPENSI
jgi:uncharacterized phage protein (TIGR02218 family)